MRRKLFYEKPQIIESLSTVTAVTEGTTSPNSGGQIDFLNYQKHCGDKSFIGEFSMDFAVIEKFSSEEIMAVEEFIIRMLHGELEIINYPLEDGEILIKTLEHNLKK